MVAIRSQLLFFSALYFVQLRIAGGGGGRGVNGPAGCYHADCDVFSLINSEQGMKNTVRFVTMLLYGLGDAPTIPVKKLTDEETKQFLLQQNLKEPLVLEGEWRWKD